MQKNLKSKKDDRSVLFICVTSLIVIYFGMITSWVIAARFNDIECKIIAMEKDIDSLESDLEELRSSLNND